MKKRRDFICIDLDQESGNFTRLGSPSREHFDTKIVIRWDTVFKQIHGGSENLKKSPGKKTCEIK